MKSMLSLLLIFGLTGGALAQNSNPLEVVDALASVLTKSNSETITYRCNGKEAVIECGGVEAPERLSKELYEKVREKFGYKTLKSGGYQLQTSWKFAKGIKPDTKPLFDFSDQKPLNCEEEISDQGEEPYYDDFYVAEYHIVTFLGPLVSYVSSMHGYSRGAVHPMAGVNLTSYDLRTGKEAKIDEFVDEKTLVRELKKNPLLLRMIKYPDQGMDGVTVPPTNEEVLNELKHKEDLNAINRVLTSAEWGCEAFWGAYTLNDFAIKSYDKKNHLLTLTIGLSHGCEMRRGNFTEIDLKVLPSKKFETILRALFDTKGKKVGDEILMEEVMFHKFWH